MQPKMAQQIEMLEVAVLVPYAENSRTHSDQQVTQIASSIEEFGFNNPVLLDGFLGIIAGHGRVLAAQRLGLAHIPCIRLHHLSDAQRRAYVIADNRIALNGGWDEEKLAAELERLKADSVDLQLLPDGIDGPIVDPYMGSGSTGVACAKLGLPFVGIELDEVHFQTACERLARAHAQANLLSA